MNTLSTEIHASDSTYSVDKDFCEGDASNPKPKEDAGLGTRFYSSAGNDMYVKEWIQGIGRQSPSPDLLTQMDRNIDGSIDGLGNRLEKAYNSDRLVPIFEFRDLNTVQTGDFEDFMTKVDQAVQDLHSG